MEINILEIFRQSFTLVILLICSMIALAASIERFWYYTKCKVDGNKVMEKMQILIEKGDFNEAIAVCDRIPAPLTNVIKTGLVNRKKPVEQLSELLESKKLEERMKLEKWLGILGTLGNTCPFIGLFGTVIGIINAFRALAASGSGGPAVVAVGIAEALVATAGGLVVAIPCVIIFNYFMRKVKTFSADMEIASKKLLVMLESK
jgi:biopolymer transport protein ExbB/TolQ